MKTTKNDIICGLDKMVPEPKCELVYSNSFELLIAVILSAQCTDKRVNQVTAELFKTHNKPEHFMEIPLEELERKIHSCGFYHNKALAIKSASFDIIERFGGNVPSKFDDLVSLRGVGRKTANVMIAEAFGGDAFAVDTHVLRVSNRLGIVKTKNPEICEEKLKKVFPKRLWSRMHYQMVLFGRYICKAQKPECEKCEFNKKCQYLNIKREKYVS